MKFRLHRSALYVQLARCTGKEVLEGVADAGYYLQMPTGERTRHDDDH